MNLNALEVKGEVCSQRIDRINYLIESDCLCWYIVTTLMITDDELQFQVAWNVFTSWS
jgi:hypothetical protein